MIDDLHHKPRQMPLRQPILDRGRKQIAGLPVNGAEVVHGGTAKLEESTARDCRYLNGKVKSDRLLGTEQVSCTRKEEAEETQPSKPEAPHDGQDFSLGNQTLNTVFVRL